MSAEQLPLFPSPELSQQAKPSQEPESSDAAQHRLNSKSPLSDAVEGFHRYMKRKGFTQHTINSFLGDLNILARYLGVNRAIGSIATKDLKQFLSYLLTERGKPCNPKSYARRLTTLKVLFQWLAEIEAIPGDPAAPIVHEPVSTPLPQILFDEEVNRLLEAGRQLRTEEKPDARPLLLFQLLLTTGVKKAECMAIKLSDLDLSDGDAGVLYIRYDNPRRRHKERKLKLGPGFAGLLREYRAQYYPQVNLFECTNRNLEYVLRDLGTLAGVKTPVSFETLRMTCAMRDYRRGVDLEALRLKLGLSRISWEETSKKIVRLAADPL